jgi:hypothetical protein
MVGESNGLWLWTIVFIAARRDDAKECAADGTGIASSYDAAASVADAVQSVAT